nr:ATP-binding cassette domain-containing protein [Burkholderiales bacterium]
MTTVAGTVTTSAKSAGQQLNSVLLRVSDITVRFGGIIALDNVSFDVRRGEIAGLIGPNGAGKTTLFNCLSRLYQWQHGSIEFEGSDLANVQRHRIAELGIGRTFQNLALFRTMSVRDNIMVGAHCRSRGGFLANSLRLPIVQREEPRVARHAAGLINLLELGPVAGVPAANLPFGMQKRVELARALAATPSLLLLDEPAA